MWVLVTLVVTVSADCLAAGVSCGDYADIGATCAELQDLTTVWPRGFPGCDCSNCTTFVERDAACSNATYATNESSLRRGVECASVNVATDVVLTAQLVVPRAANLEVYGGSMRAGGLHRILLVGSDAVVALSATRLADGYSDTLGGCVAMRQGSSLVATDVIFDNCHAYVGGGAVAVWDGGFLTLRDARVVDAATGAVGGAVFAQTNVTVSVVGTTEIHRPTAQAAAGVFAFRDSLVVFRDDALVSRATVAQFASSVMVSHGAILSLDDRAHLASGASDYADVYVLDATLVMKRESRITNCTARSSAGVVATQNAFIDMGGNATVEGCRGGEGGGISVFGSELVMRGQSKVSKCHGLTGGGIVSTGTVLMRDEARVEHCDASNRGGGIAALCCETSRAEDEPVHRLSLVELRDRAAVVYNYASEFGGGGVFANDAHIYLRDQARVWGNVAGLDGGGVFATISSFVIAREDVVIGNSFAARDGGGLYVEQFTIVQLFDHVRVERNVAGRYGGGLFVGDICVVMMRGSARVERNDGETGGAAYVRGEVYASSVNVTIVKLIFDYGGTSASYVEEKRVLVEAAGQSSVAAATVDVRGRPTIATAADPYDAIYCLSSAQNYTVHVYDGVAEGWFDGSAVLIFMGEEGAPNLWDLGLDRGVHATSLAAPMLGTVYGDKPVIASNRAVMNGGGLHVDSSGYAVFHDAVFINNNAGPESGRGGGLYASVSARVELTSCLFQSNRATEGGFVAAAALGRVDVNDSIAFNNSARKSGGFASFRPGDSQTAEIRLARLEVRDNAATDVDGSGGAVVLRSSGTAAPVFLNDIRFLRNRVVGREGIGGALYMQNAAARVSAASSFECNEVETGPGGGAVAAMGVDSRLEFLSSFADSSLACRTPLTVIADYTATTESCRVTNQSASYTCDYWQRVRGDGCSESSNGGGSVQFDCAGCACFDPDYLSTHGGDRFFEIADDDTGEVLHVGTARAASWTRYDYCLEPGRAYKIRGVDNLGDGWYGGVLRVSSPAVDSGEERVVTVEGYESLTPLHIDVPYDNSIAVTFASNAAPRGGGGDLFWDMQEPRGYPNATHRDGKSFAEYGNATATPAAELRIDSGVEYAANSSGPLVSKITRQPVIAALYDRKDQLVVSDSTSAVFVDLQDNGQSEARASGATTARVDRGVATFSDLRVSGRANHTYTLVATSSRASRLLETTFVMITVDLIIGECDPGYFYDTSTAACSKCPVGHFASDYGARSTCLK